VNRKIAIFSIVTVLGVVIDQITKYVVRASEAINAPGGVEVIPHFFSIVHAENPGAALGMLGSLSEPWRIAIFVGFTIIAGIIVFDLFRRLPPGEMFLSTTLGLILSGALGNAIDRVAKPLWGDAATVTDFLRFYTDDPDLSQTLIEWFGMAEYPSFNVADINLVVGVGLFLVHYLFIESRQSDDEDELDDDELAALEDEDTAEDELDDETSEADEDEDTAEEARGA